MGFFGKLFDSMKQAVRNRLELDKNNNTIQLLLDTKDENYFTLRFDTLQVENLYDPSVQKAYKLLGEHQNLGTLYIETIELQFDQDWNCSPGSAFSQFVNEQFKKDQLKYIDSIDTDFTKFSKYQLNYENEIGVIWINLNKIDIFIIDLKGKLFNDLLEIYTIKNQELFISDIDKQIPLQINNSLTSTNMRENYFSKKD